MLDPRPEIARAFVAAATSGDCNTFRRHYAALAEIGTIATGLRALVDHAAAHPNPVHPKSKTAFADIWIGEDREFTAGLPDGTRLRAILADDVDLLADALRLLVPPAPSVPLAIFRGQSAKEHAAGITGFSWSPNPMLAEIYARHPTINAHQSVVIVKFMPEACIIGQVSDVEIIVDPRKVGFTSVLYTPDRKLTQRELASRDVAHLNLLALHDIHANAAA